MPQIVSPKLLIDGSEFLSNSSYQVFLSQSMGNHGHFRVSFPTNATEGYQGALMDNALASVGKKISIGLNDGDLEFVGIITSIDLGKQNGAPGTLVLSGYSPSILLSSSVQCLSYEEGTSLSQILTDTCNGHTTSLLKTTIGDGTNINLPYTVQYNEDDFSFIRRLCARYGVWLYDNGKGLQIGNIAQKQHTGTYGADISTFDLSANLKERSFGIKAQDWVNNTDLEADSLAYRPQVGHPYASTVDDASTSLFTKKSNLHWPLDQSEYSGQQGMDRATKVATIRKTAAMLIASGTTEITGQSVGDILTVEGLNFSDAEKKDPYGTYLITHITHRFDHSGHYSNEFRGVPEGTEHPEYSNIFSAPFARAQRGTVLENADPQGLGRIKVQFPWQKHRSTSTPWIKLQTPYSGAGKGFYMIPELGEEVLVGFEGGDPERPFMLSAGYNASATSGIANADNNIKAIITRSGHRIELNDTDGAESITIKDKNENLFQIDTATNDITIHANNNLAINAVETIKLSAKNIELSAIEDVIEDAGKSISATAGQNHNIMAKNKNSIIEEKNTEQAKLSEKTAEEIVVNSTAKNMTLFSQKSVDIQSNEKVKLF